jgi:hypothetical protein
MPNSTFIYKRASIIYQVMGMNFSSEKLNSVFWGLLLVHRGLFQQVDI